MKVLLVCSASFKTGQTGDATQGRETVKALRKKGHEVDVILVDYFPLRFHSEDDRLLDEEAMKRIVEGADVIHLLPVNPILCKFFRHLPKKPTLGSSIFWGGWERAYLAWKNGPDLRSKIHDGLRSLKPMFGYGMDYRGIDVFLPNSQAEGECVLKYFKTDVGASYEAIPNGFVAPNREKLEGLKHPPNVPVEDYIVVPGIFARRKNQLSLIKALKNSPYPVVFVGGRAGGGHSEYLDRCQVAANNHMHFLGFVPSTSDEYWAILKYARCACLASDCETPGIAMIEAAYAGARPVITKHGGTCEYYGFDAEYLDPCSETSIRKAIDRAWNRGRLTVSVSMAYARYSWEYCAEVTLQAYRTAMGDGI